MHIIPGHLEDSYPSVHPKVDGECLRGGCRSKGISEYAHPPLRISFFYLQGYAASVVKMLN